MAAALSLAQFNAGLGQKFQDQTGRHCVNLSLYEEDALQAAQGAVYPLVVRLEVLADGSQVSGAFRCAAGRQRVTSALVHWNPPFGPPFLQGKSLDSLPPGAAQPEWVQSQTTFAELKKGEDGTWSAKVIKQKIWVSHRRKRGGRDLGRCVVRLPHVAPFPCSRSSTGRPTSCKRFTACRAATTRGAAQQMTTTARSASFA